MYARSCSLCEEGTSFCAGLISRKFLEFVFIFLTGLHSGSSAFFFVRVSVSIDFLSNSKEDSPIYCIVFDYFCADWDGLWDYQKCFKGDIFSLAAYEFCECVILHHKYQKNPNSS